MMEIGIPGRFVTWLESQLVHPTSVSALSFAKCPRCVMRFFTHEGSLTHIHETVGDIVGEWLPNSDHEAAAAPDFERYDDRFDPMNDTGEFEYWGPLR